MSRLLSLLLFVILIMAMMVLSSARADAQWGGWGGGQAMGWENQRDVALANRLGYNSLDAFRSDQNAARQAQDEALRRDTLNRPVEWANRQTGNRGRSQIVETGRDGMGNPCRVIQEELLVQGRLTRQSGMVCYDGRRWVGVSGR